MGKYIFTYSLIAILTTSIVLPTYFSLSEKKCETSLVINDTENDGDENMKEELELKFFYNNNIISSFKIKESHKPDLYFFKVYNSVSKKLDSPPPESLV
ncbi:hypothetical protein [Tenacibaculum sp. 190524A02b]|uniref:Uncharacterized protein n=1 Tax=Tenacibaculum vairaonense TaxID=3137860 RepID=A0ABM9PMN7_9FLAO